MSAPRKGYECVARLQGLVKMAQMLATRSDILPGVTPAAGQGAGRDAHALRR